MAVHLFLKASFPDEPLHAPIYVLCRQVVHGMFISIPSTKMRTSDTCDEVYTLWRRPHAAIK